MPEPAWPLLLGFYVLIILRWLWGHVELTRGIRSGILVPATGVDPKALNASVTIIIAAHNEADTITPCLQAVLAQNYPDLKVVVVNDRSTDATGRIVRDLARRHPNLRCIDIQQLPPGWLGKTHAVWAAARHADSEFLMFTDSDVHLHPDALTTAIHLMRAERLDFLTLWPKVIVASFWERLLVPACGWMLNLWFSNDRPARIESTPVFANGSFLVIRKDAYEKIGGHASVPDEIAEDVALARRASRAGLRRYTGFGTNLIQTRMYENLAQIVSGWTRIFIGALGARWKLASCIVVASLGGLSPFVVLFVLAGWAASGGQIGPMQSAWLIAAAVHLVVMYSVTYRLFARGFAGGVYFSLFPLALVGVIVLLIRCLRLIGGAGTIRWGNMRYQVRGSRAVRSRQVAS